MTGALRFASLVLAAAISFTAARAQTATGIAPVSTIYPGDIIASSMIAAAAIDGDPANFLLSPSEAVGKVARRTLFAGRPIPRWAVDEPESVRNGAPVRLVYDTPGLFISSVGQALQPGRAGDAIRVRNSDSGLVVVGRIAPDGTVLVER